MAERHAPYALAPSVTRPAPRAATPAAAATPRRIRRASLGSAWISAVALHSRSIWATGAKLSNSAEATNVCVNSRMNSRRSLLGRNRDQHEPFGDRVSRRGRTVHGEVPEEPNQHGKGLGAIFVAVSLTQPQRGRVAASQDHIVVVELHDDASFGWRKNFRELALDYTHGNMISELLQKSSPVRDSVLIEHLFGVGGATQTLRVLHATPGTDRGRSVTNDPSDHSPDCVVRIACTAVTTRNSASTRMLGCVCSTAVVSRISNQGRFCPPASQRFSWGVTGMHAQPFQDCVDWHCYGCGRLNDHGLQIKSHWDGDDVVCRWQAKPFHVGLPGRLQGGVIATTIICHTLWTTTATTS